MAEILLKSLGRVFGERRVFADVDLTVEAGERLLIRGPNGSGKSTLVKIMAGLLEPTEGRVLYRTEGGEKPPEEVRSEIGYLAPDLVLYEELTPMENLDFFARLRGLPTGRANLELLDRVGLKDRAEDPVGTFSTGLKQRAKMAFALQNRPRFLFLDEPGSNLDDLGRDLVRRMVEDHRDPDAVVVIASNDPEEFRYGTRTYELG